MTELLKADAVSVWRGDNLLLDNISFAVRAGEVLQVHGANGSGKTTLLRVVCGLGYAEDGHVLWRGEPMSVAAERFNRELLYLGHRAGIKSSLTPLENLAFFAAARPRTETASSSSQASTLAENTRLMSKRALSELGLQSVLNVPCRHLSAGQQRRVSLARLVLQSATLWVLDEPLTSLDSDGLDWVRSQIECQVTGGGAVLLTTHAALPFDSIKVNALELT